MIVLKILLDCFLFIYLVWAGYGLMMALLRAHDAGTLTTAAKVLGYPLLVVFLIIDALLNYTLCSVLFLELPDRWLTTNRLQKYMYHMPDTWRGKMAKWLCHNLLDCLAPDGCHCKRL